MSSSSLKLRSGALMPKLGLGTLLAKDQEIIDAVLKALEVGYRHIDTAFVYRNESAIGGALQIAFQKGLVKREELFITTKLPSNGHEPDKVRHFLEVSLKALQLSYVDLYLVHSPISFQYRTDDEVLPVENGKAVLDYTDLVTTWKAMEELVDAGLAKDIGVSNFNSQQVKLICDNARIKPSNNQVECHIFLQQHKLFKFCQDLGVTITAYATFGSPQTKEWREMQYNKRNIVIPDHFTVLDNEVLLNIGKKYGKTSSQVALRSLVQRGLIVIPKSSNPNRIEQNFEIFDFDLSDEDEELIRALDNGIRFFKSDNVEGQTEHPNFPYNIEF